MNRPGCDVGSSHALIDWTIVVKMSHGLDLLIRHCAATPENETNAIKRLKTDGRWQFGVFLGHDSNLEHFTLILPVFWSFVCDCFFQQIPQIIVIQIGYLKSNESTISKFQSSNVAKATKSEKNAHRLHLKLNRQFIWNESIFRFHSAD